jgi:hypothetical protein
VPRRRSRKNPKRVVLGINFVLRYSRVHILGSALKHDATKSDISHAVRYFISQYEIGQSDIADRLLIIGPKPDGMLVEILGVLGSDETLTVFHCMHLRPHWVNVLKENQ